MPSLINHPDPLNAFLADDSRNGRHRGPAEWRGWVDAPEEGDGWYLGDGPPPCLGGCGLEGLAVLIVLAAAFAAGWLACWAMHGGGP